MRNRARTIRRLLYMVYLGFATLLGAELTLRFFVDSDPAYYVAFSDPEPGTVVEYPYGEIYYNADGFADDEFDAQKTRPRVGYIGDSVCFGVARRGHRVSELMELSYPQYEHMNFTGGLGGGTLEFRSRAVKFGEQYELDAVVYMLNLNDIRPEGQSDGLNNLQQRGVFRAIEWFRGRSYLYTYLRQILKELRNTGTPAPVYEMFPNEHRDVVLETTRRIGEIEEELGALGIRLVVLIVPYEMQVSAEAERVYAEAGTDWEEGFIEGSTQSLLIDQFSFDNVVDGLAGFLGSDLDPQRREELGVGESFVYNLGERMDWNHPNRLGHRLLAEELARSGVLDDLGGD